MNVEIGTETPIFLFWEYLFRNLYFVFAVYEQLLLTAVKYCTHHAPPFLLQLGKVKCRTGPALEPSAYLVAIAVPG